MDEVLDGEEVRAHTDLGAVGIVDLQCMEDRTVLGVRCDDGTLLVHRAPHAPLNCPRSESFDQGLERWIAGGAGDDPVKGDVDEHDRLVVDRACRVHQPLDRGEDGVGLSERGIVDSQRRATSGLGLKNASHRLQVGAVGCSAEVDHEADGGQQEALVQRGHICAVALACLKNAHDAERADSFTQRAAGDAQLTCEVLFDRQTGPGSKRPVRDHAFDPVDDHVGLRS